MSEEKMPLIMKKRVKILIVDDEVVLRELYKTLIKQIQSIDAEVFEADNAADALKIIKEQNIYLLIQDLELRQPLNGWDIIRQLREFNNEIRIFILSAWLFEGVEDAEKLNKFKVTKAIKKAVNTAEFKYYVDKILHDENYFDTVDKIDERIIKHKLEVKHLMHDVKGKLSKIHGNCLVASIKFTTDDYIKKDPEKAALEATKVLDDVTELLGKMVRSIDETDVQ